jgi:dCMP deaminase
VSTGYNGAPQGVEHCCEIGCLREKLAIPSGERHEMCRGSHAELNAIAQAAKIGVSTESATIMCTHEPCSFCTKAILNAGIKEVVFLYSYPDKLARDMMAESKITVRQLDESSLELARGFIMSTNTIIR